MRKIILSFFLLFIVTSGSSAYALCLPFAATKTNILRCEDNFQLGHMADQCLSLLTREVTAHKQNAASFSATDSQQGAMNENKAALARAMNQLDELILKGESAKLAVSTYGNNLFMPEDYDNPKLTGMSTAKYLATVQCYAVPNRVIREDAEMIELMLSDLKKVRASASVKSSTSAGQAEKLGSGVTAPLPAGKAARVLAPPAGPKGPGYRPSDISGTKEEKK
jgi:hypothetical protein